MKKVAPLLLLAMSFLACSTDNENIINPELNEEWVLNNVVCFCFFGDDFDFSTHTLTFNPGAKEVVIGNTGDSEFIAPAGTYGYTDNGEIMEIDGRQYTYQIKGDTLTLVYVDNPGIADDEISYFYIKN